LKQLSIRSEALELAYYGGFTQAELAERLGSPSVPSEQNVHGSLADARVAA
jgi:DNA-directed RNA polymerase specialized sigma24 family protein